jgi:hypothetical protein
VHARHGRALHSIDLDAWVDSLEEECHACEKTSATHGHHHRIHVRVLLQQLHRDRAGTGNYLRIVEGMNESSSLFLGELHRILVRFAERLPRLHDPRTKLARALHFGVRSIAGHDDDTVDAQAGGMVGDCLGMVAGGGADDSSGTLLRRELEQLVQRSALLVRTRDRQMLLLDVQLATDQRTDARAVVARSTLNSLRNALECLNERKCRTTMKEGIKKAGSTEEDE